MASPSRLGVPQLLDRAHLDDPDARGREPRGQRTRLVDVLGLDEEEAAELLLGLGEGAVGGGRLAPRTRIVRAVRPRCRASETM